MYVRGRGEEWKDPKAGVGASAADSMGRRGKVFNLTFPSLPIPMVFLDFSKVTERAIDDGRTSDGCHFMTDVNMIKFMTIANLMAAMAEM